MPRLRQSLWGGELVVVWDRAAHLQPYQEDFQAIVTDLLRQRGTGGFTLWLVDGSPQQVRQRWPEKPAHAGRVSAPRPEAIAAAGAGERAC
ncbi:MAG: hypothetical protein V5B40_11100 [Candidatus Accumulibacter meliphilus]|uniref:hypothetical protein n=1 Tax=Candidatus Accumulibacter meliphilus TaxID=2211374 RepID=UPI002FC33617